MVLNLNLTTQTSIIICHCPQGVDHSEVFVTNHHHISQELSTFMKGLNTK